MIRYHLGTDTETSKAIIAWKLYEIVFKAIIKRKLNTNEELNFFLDNDNCNRVGRLRVHFLCRAILILFIEYCLKSCTLANKICNL